MTLAVLTEAPLLCDMALGNGVLTVTQNQTVLCSGVPFATTLDCVADENIPPLGMCSSLGNPITESQTDAADGVLTPGECEPVPSDPWVCANETVLIDSKPMLDQTGMLVCSYGGEIVIEEPLCTNVTIP